MGTQTMGSNGRTQNPKLDNLSRQGCLYNLTLDEVQQQLGKPFSSMNLDELLKSVYTAETNQGATDYSEFTQFASDLTKKTVDQVWQDIQQGGKSEKNSNNNNGNQERQRTLGEMTLEDFLVKAGIVVESNNQELILHPEKNLEAQETQWMQYQIPQIQYQVQQPLMETGYNKMQMTISPLGGLSETHMSGRKRVASGVVVEKVVERRQKRMIKNRESAARSRARKQAYTHELENKVSRLEEENERLRRKKEVEKVLPRVPPPEPKYQLRRTTSASF